MLSDYRNYLISIRNNLIQCGVEIPISNLDSYESIFAIEGTLKELLWFYSILEISGSSDSLSNFILPLNGYFKEKMRSIFYREYLDFSKEYATISIEHALLEKGIVPESLKGESINLFEDDFQEVEDVQDINTELKESTEDYTNPWDEYDNNLNSQSEEVLEVSHGTYLDFDDTSNILKEHQETTTSHGVYLDSDEESEESNEKVVTHGVYIDEDTEEDWGFEASEEDALEEDPFEDPSDEDGLDDISWDSEDQFEEPNEEDGLGDEDEDPFEEPNEEDGLAYNEDEDPFEDPSDEDGLGDEDEDPFEDPSDEDGFSEDYEEDPFEEPNEEDSFSEDYDEDPFEDPSDEDGFSESYDEDPFEDPDEEDDLAEDFGEEPKKQEDKSSILSKSTKEDKESLDIRMSNALQDFTNGLLTAGRNSINKQLKKLKG